MKIIILGGFLGSGKTSLLISMAEYLSKHNTETQRTPLAIIENEIGEVSIDNKILENGGYSVSTLSSGCICCSLAGDLTIAINDIAEKYNPVYSVIEATGLAYPDNIAETIKQFGKHIENIAIIAIVDAERWEENYEVLEILMTVQIKNADIILLNKIDTVDSDTVSQIALQLKEINNHAVIYPVSAVNGIENKVWSAILGGTENA